MGFPCYRPLLDSLVLMQSFNRLFCNFIKAGNIMVQKQDDVSVKVKVLDFGLAGSLHSDKDGMKGFRTDIAEIVRKFSALYTGEEFDNETDLQKNWKEKMKMVNISIPILHMLDC